MRETENELMPGKKERKQKEGEFCVCLEVGSRKDIVTDMNIESTW